MFHVEQHTTLGRGRILSSDLRNTFEIELRLLMFRFETLDLQLQFFHVALKMRVLDRACDHETRDTVNRRTVRENECDDRCRDLFGTQGRQPAILTLNRAAASRTVLPNAFVAEFQTPEFAP